MFTGIVQSVGRMRALERRGAGARLRVGAAGAALRRLKLGDSIAVNGCCLTLVARTRDSFSADLSRETMAVTALGDLQPGARVNLEAPLRAGDALSGHQMQGHVEATGTFRGLDPDGEEGGWRLRVEVPAALLPYIVSKGTLAVEGISLTVARIRGRRLDFAIIPHTWRHTHLRFLTPGARVNLETDPLARHLERLLEARAARPRVISLREWRRQGF